MDESALQSLVSKATHFSTHSGEVGEGGIFIALKGEARDAHDFIPDVLKKNVLAVFSEKDFSDPRVHRVKSTQETHWKIASLFRKKFKGVVIGVGGSSGKTSTKELLHHVLSKKFKCVKTEKSQNGLLGIPRTLEKLRSDVEVAIVEIGIDAPNEMIRNVTLVEPTHALLTSIGEEHLLLLKNLEGVFTEERILLDYTFRNGGKTYCPASDPYLAKISTAKQLPDSPEKLNAAITVSATDKHTLQNMTVVAAIALDLGMSAAEIKEALESSELPDGRGLKWSLGGNEWVIRDHYNANPSSMKVALESAQKFSSHKALPLRLILGDMRELGNESLNYHKEIVELARSLHAEKILWVGPEMTQAAASLASNEYSLPDSTAEIPKSIMIDFKTDGVTLVKASRGTALEKIMDRIYGRMT